MQIPPRSGTTLLELACALALLGVILGIGMPPLANARDVLAVRAARDAIVAASARTRAHAVNHGGAELHIDAAAGTLRIVTRDSAVDETSPITRSIDVELRLTGTSATAAVLSYDALGIGRVASRTIAVRRGSVAGGVTFSSYGRPRVW
jgi:prepilin-type N-terminal cleavage/methylation domain-containing protein